MWYSIFSLLLGYNSDKNVIFIDYIWELLFILLM